MALFRKFFYRKPPEGLLEISERVYVFDCCFTTNLLEGNEYEAYIGRIVDQIREYFPDASFMVFSFGDGDHHKVISNVLSKYGITLVDYPSHYENCPLLTVEMIHHFLRSSESWLCIGHRNVILMHCQNGAFPVLAFMLSAFLIYRKQYTGEKKTLDMLYKQAPQELLHLLLSLNPLPSQLRYLQYVSRRNIGSQWPPLDRALTLDCVILRVIPNMDRKGGCRPIFRIYGPDPLMAADRKTKMLFSMPKKSKAVGYFKQADCELVKIDINCHVQGDVVLECITLDDNLEHEEIMFRVMFNTAFLRSNVLMLNREEIDILWNAKDQFPKDFRAEVLFSEMDSSSSLFGLDLPGIQDIEGLPIEAFAKVQDMFNNLDWVFSERDNALNIIKQMTVSSILEEKHEITSFTNARIENSLNVSQIVKVEKLESIFFQDDIEEGLKSGSSHVNEAESNVSSNTVQKGTFSSASHNVVEDGGFPEASPTMVESPKCEGFDNDTSYQAADLSETTSASSNTTKKVESRELHVSVQRPAQSKIISAWISQSSSSNPASYSNSSQGSPVALSRYHTAPSAVGITALLHDHAEFSHKGVCTPESSISASAPSLKTAEPTDSSVSPPEKHPMGKRYTNSKSASRPPPPPPSPQVSLSTLTSQPQLRLPSAPLPSSVPPPPPPPPIQSNCQLCASESSGTPSRQLSKLQPPPSLSLLSSTAPSSPQPPPPPPPLHSNSDLSASQLPTTPYSHDPLMSGHVDHSPATSPHAFPPLTALAGPSFRNQSSAPSFPSPTPHPSSVIDLPGLSSTLSAYPPPPLPLSPIIGTAKPPSLSSVPSPPPPPPTSSNVSVVQNSFKTIPPPPAPLPGASSVTYQDSSVLPAQKSTVPASPPPPSPPQCVGSAVVSPSGCSAPPPPCPPSLVQKDVPAGSRQVVPPPPPPLLNASPKAGDTSLQLHSSASTLLGGKGKLQLRTSTRTQAQSKKTSLKPYHWLKLTRAMQGSLWAEAQKPEEASKAPELDMSELESLFSAAVPNSNHGGSSGKTNRRGSGLKSDKVHLIELRRAYNCEIMLTKVKIPLSDLMNSVLALDDSALDIDQVDNLIKFCPTKEEIELLKNYKGDKENLGKCEQFFLELMKVPRVESKLRVFSFKIQFCSQVSDLRNSLNIVNSASEEVRNSVKLKRIMQTILTLGNALNHGTARGSAVGFRLDSLPKLAETRARNNKLTLIHYLCKVLAEKLPEVLDFHEDLVSLEAATKIQLKYLAEEMQAISKGLEKVAQELTASENDGAVSDHFCKTLKKFLGSAEAEVRSLALRYSGVGRNADALALYFGEDPARCPFEQVVSTLLNFVRMFRRAHEENCKQLEFEKKKKAQEEAENGKGKSNNSRKELENDNMMGNAARVSELQSQP